MPLRVADKVKVPWDLQREVGGEIVEIWGDPAQCVKVRLKLAEEDEVGPMVLLLSPSALVASWEAM